MQRKNLILAVGWGHLIGGGLLIAGLLFPTRLLGTGPPSWPDYWYLAGLPLATLSIVSGLMLLRRRPGARRIAALVEGLQLFGFYTGSSGYIFQSGIQLLLVLMPTYTGASVSATSQFGIGPAMSGPSSFVLIDLFTPIAWWLLWRGRPEVPKFENPVSATPPPAA